MEARQSLCAGPALCRETEMGMEEAGVVGRDAVVSRCSLWNAGSSSINLLQEGRSY